MDNYAEFIERLDTATVDLRKRRAALGEPLKILLALEDQNTVGLLLWEQRRVHADELLAGGSWAPGPHSTLTDLHQIARTMEPMFRKRTQRIGERVTAVRDRLAKINETLLELEKSRLKLNTSRILSQERAKLSKAVAELAGTMETPTGPGADPDLKQALRDAREAVILAESLLEVKGN